MERNQQAILQNEKASVEPRNHSAVSLIQCKENCPNEDQHIILRPSWRASYLSICLCPLSLWIAVAGTRLLPKTILRVPLVLGDDTYTLQFPLLLLLTLLFVLKIVHKVYNSYYKVTCLCLCARTGIFSFQSQCVALPLIYVQAVKVKQNIIERLLNVGTIEVGSAMTSCPEVKIEGIMSPETYSRTIRQGMDEVQRLGNNGALMIAGGER